MKTDNVVAVIFCLCCVAVCCAKPSLSRIPDKIIEQSMNRLQNKAQKLKTLARQVFDKVEETGKRNSEPLNKEGETVDKGVSSTHAQNVLLQGGYPQFDAKCTKYTYEFPINFAQRLQGDEVGFHVSLVVPKIMLAFDVNLRFDKEVINMGQAYNMSSSTFTCPQSGTYFISLSIACKDDRNFEVSVVKDNVDYVLNLICGSPSGARHQNSGTAILTLIKNERLSVERVWPSAGEVTVLGNGLTTFSGYLLRNS